MANTTFIIGAGCSLAYKMPSSIEIIEEILRRLENPQDINNHLYTFKVAPYETLDKELFERQELPFYKKLNEKIYYSGVMSIDDFLSQYDEKAKDGRRVIETVKYLIFDTIRKSELNCIRKKYLDSNLPDIELFSFKENYLRILFKKEFIKENHVKLIEHLKDNHYCFIILNYDRCVEYFLGKAIQNYYGFNDEKLNEVFNEKIIFKHVYGTLHEEKLNIAQIISDYEHGFDQESNTHNYSYPSRAFRNIRTIRRENDSELNEIRDNYVDRSSKIYILGLGYNETNFRIFPDKKYVYGRDMLLTTKGMSEGDINKIRERFFKDGQDQMNDRREWSAYTLLNHLL